jgi:3-deoxy-D-arabino-heptulosonate 7-phosphate (DAHP) synthase
MTPSTRTPAKVKNQIAKAPAPRKTKVETQQSPRAKPVATKPIATKPMTKQAVAAPAKPLKDKKVKVVRDSFTIPKTELLQITDMKKRALGLGVEIKKSELIRAGLQALLGLTDANFKKALSSVPTIKTGRPAKN